MKNLFATFQFLTILPMGKPRTVEAAKMVPWFPVVGLAIGLIMVMGDYVFSMLWPGTVVALLEDVVTTGGTLVKVIDRVEAQGLKVGLIATVVDRQEGGVEALAAKGYRLESIFTRQELLA